MRKLERALSLALVFALSGCSDDEPAPSRSEGDAGAAGERATPGAEGGSGGVGASSSTGGGGDGGAGDATGHGGVAGAPGETIGPDGGEVSVPGASVSIAAGALATEEVIGVAEVALPIALPASYEALSPVFAFTPHGLTFQSPVAISIAYEGDADTVLKLDDDADISWEPMIDATYANDVASFETTSFSYYVVARFVAMMGTVSPLYPTAPGFNDYVKNDGSDLFRSSGTACDPNYSSEPQAVYRECIHSGEHRAVPVTGRASCAGLSAVDDLGAFDWTCEVLGGTATMISTGFRDDAGLSTLIDFALGAWRSNSVSVSDGGMVILTTPSDTWWNDPIQVDNDGMTTSTAGTIYLVTQDSAAFYKLTGNGSALLVEPGSELTGAHVGGPNTGRVELGGAFGLYFEGSVGGTGERGIHLSGSHHTLRNVRVSGFNSPIGPPRRSRIENAKLTCATSSANPSVVLANGNLIRRVKLANCTNTFGVNGHLNVLEDVFSSGGRISVGAANQIMAGVTAHHSPENGVEVASEGNLLMHVTTVHNLGYGFQATSGNTPNRVIGLLSTENRVGGIYLDENVVLRSVGSFANTQAGINFNPYGFGNVFEGAFTTGLNGDQPDAYYPSDGGGCFDPGIPATGDCYGSRAATTSGSPNGLLSLPTGLCGYDTNSNVTDPFNPPIRGPGYPLPERVRGEGFGDTVNPNDGPDGNSTFANVTNWVDFESFYRGWGSEGPATPSCDSQGPCTATSSGPAGCQIFDYRLRYGSDTFIARTPSYPDGDAVLTHVFSTASGYLLDETRCASLFKHSVYDDTARTCTVTFLASAREVLGDMRGNENLLCESGEVCLYTANIASYQGEGPLVAPMDYVFVDGAIDGVTLLTHETNGTMLPYSP